MDSDTGFESGASLATFKIFSNVDLDFTLWYSYSVIEN